MADRSKVTGLANAYAIFDAVPDAAREQMGIELAIIARDFLAVQRQQAPKLTGKLASGLSILLLLDELRVRIGIIASQKRAGTSRKAKRSPGGGLNDLYYGRFVALGRSAQTVTVQRRRRVGGVLRTQSRGSRKRVEDIVATYSLKVKARAPNPFIEVANADTIAASRLAAFWSKVTNRIEGTAA